VERAAEQRGAARSGRREDTGCGAALAAKSRSSQAERRISGAIGADIAGGRARGARPRASDRGAAPPRAGRTLEAAVTFCMQLH
jgi:hypothetical protein